VRGRLLLLAVWTAQAAHAQENIAEAWDALLQGTTKGQPGSQPSHNTAGDFLNHFFFESKAEYRRYATSFTSSPTATGVIDAPFTGIFNPNGIPYPPVFQADANRIYSFVDWGTRGWLSERVNTHFAYRYEQDLSHVNTGAPAANAVETFSGNRALELVNAAVEINAKATDGGWAGTSLQVGRQYVYGAELAALDGASLTFDRRRFSVTVFGGRRFSYYSDPEQRAIGGANAVFRLGRETSIEYQGLWYIKGSNSLLFRKRFGAGWLFSSYFRAYGGSPVDFSAQGLYLSGQGKTTMRLSFFQKLTNRDYYYDYSYFATDRDPYNRLQRLYLNPISPYSQFVVDAHRTLTPGFQVGGSVWVRHLNNSGDQGPFDTSFQDYRAHAQMFPLRKFASVIEYHQRNSDRLSPGTATTFDDIRAAGETSVKDFTGELRRGFGDGRLSLSAGAYYRRISVQDQFSVINGAHQSGWLAGGWLIVDQHSRLYLDYNLDNDFFIFRPSIANSRILRLGWSWKY
jgi:hypothetical protein